jgi:uncharacterized protein (TIGR03000 family)
MYNRVKFAIVTGAALAAFGISSPAFAQHGHGGHGHGGHGHGGHGHWSHGHSGHYHGHHHHGGIGIHFGSSYGYGYSPYYSGYGSYYGDSYGVYAPRRVYVARPVIAVPTNVASVEIRLPEAQGEYWLQGIKQGGSGTVRSFRSPELIPGKNYFYTVTAAWHDGGRLVTEERRVAVQSNSSVLVDFTQPVAAADGAAAPPDVPPLPEPAPAQ